MTIAHRYRKQGRSAGSGWAGLLRLAAWPLLSFLLLLGSVNLLEDRYGPSQLADPAWDGQRTYLRMAEAPVGHPEYEPPFGWRIFPPLLARVLPLPPTSAYRLIATVALAGTVVATVWMLVGLGIPDRSASAAGVALVCLGPAIGLPLRFHVQADPLAFGLLSLSMGAAAHRRGPLLAGSLILLAATKELALLGILFAGGLALERRDPGFTAWTTAGSLFALGVMIGIRLVVPLEQPYGWLAEFRAFWVPSTGEEIARSLVNVTGLTWHVLLPVAALQLQHPPRSLRRLPLAAILVASTAQMLIADSSPRVAVAAFPAMLAVAGFEIECLAARFDTRAWRLWIGVTLAGMPWFVSQVVRVPVPGLGWASGVITLTTALVIVWAVAGRAMMRRSDR